ncbi:MAG TPA: hypothetical protein VF613_11600 [Longimicrobium sp.]|jgi:hypothetical protein
MLSSTSTPAAIPGYKLQPPGEADACAALQRVFGAERGSERWSLACRAAGLRRGRVSTADELGRAVEALAEQGGATAVVARSLEIRLRTYARLAARTTGGAR